MLTIEEFIIVALILLVWSMAFSVLLRRAVQILIENRAERASAKDRAGLQARE